MVVVTMVMVMMRTFVGMLVLFWGLFSTMRLVLVVRMLRALHMGQPRVNIKLYSSDPPAGLTLEMQVKVSQLNLGEFPFEC
jgi:hypothetical protein